MTTAKSLFISALLIFTAACATEKKLEVKTDEGAENLPFEKGLKALEKENYAEAAQIFDRLLVAKPATESDLVTSYNSGAAHEGMGHCAKAAERYREVVRSSIGKYKQLEGVSLFRLSLMYECLGQDTKAITALLDAQKRGKQLPFETLKAEIPARLAAAYARIGNRQKALEYFGQASEGLKKLVGQTQNHKQNEILAKTLFLMGQLSPSQRDASAAPISYMQSLSMQQPYLMQAVEMGHALWSRKAADDLTLAYNNIWKFRLDEGEQRRDFYTRGLQAVQELKKIRLPSAGADVNEIYAQVEKVEAQLNVELSKVAEYNKLTPAAEAREGLKRQGRAVDPPEATLPKKPKAKR